MTPPTPPRTRRNPIVLGASALLPLAGLNVPGSGIPLNEVAVALVVTVALLRRGRHPLPGWFFLGLVGFVASVVASTLANDQWDLRRLSHVLLVVALLWVIASGRIKRWELLPGLLVGLVGAALVGLGQYALGRSTGYEGRLTGVISDPNQAGLFFVGFGAVALAACSNSAARRWAAVILMSALVLTLSRTSMLAAALAGLWLVLGRRLNRPAGLLLVLSFAWAVSRIPETLKTSGVFASRTGSDALREEIVELEWQAIESSVWLGHGPGTAQVSVSGQPFFYHNSYLAVWAEFGLLALACLLLLTLAIWFFGTAPRGARDRWAEAGVLATLVCAINLGEVLLEFVTPVTLGLLMASRWASPTDPPADAPHVTADSRAR